MKIISQEAMLYGSTDDAFRQSQWYGYEIRVSGLNMQEVEDVVERFNKNSPILGPMRSPLSQKAANAVQNILTIDAGGYCWRGRAVHQAPGQMETLGYCFG